MKWYEQRYVNRRDWILDNLELLGLNEKETILVLMIDFMNDHQIDISIDSLHQKTGLSLDEVDQIISLLCAKKYLEIRASAKAVYFRLDGLYDTNIAKKERVIEQDLFDIFETEMKKTLSQKEMEKIAEWNRTTDRRLIIYALREASAYQKVTLPYIESILTDWKAKGFTPEMIEEGIHVYGGNFRKA